MRGHVTCKNTLRGSWRLLNTRLQNIEICISCFLCFPAYNTNICIYPYLGQYYSFNCCKNRHLPGLRISSFYIRALCDGEPDTGKGTYLSSLLELSRSWCENNELFDYRRISQPVLIFSYNGIVGEDCSRSAVEGWRSRNTFGRESHMTKPCHNKIQMCQSDTTSVGLHKGKRV